MKIFLSSSLDVKGLQSIELDDTVGSACDSAAGANGTVTGVNNTKSFPTGLVVGIVMGGMCVILLALFAVRQWRSRGRRADTRTLGDGEPTKEDADDFHMTSIHSVGIAQGISASPDDCSERGGKGADVEAACKVSDNDTSQDTTDNDTSQDTTENDTSQDTAENDTSQDTTDTFAQEAASEATPVSPEPPSSK